MLCAARMSEVSGGVYGVVMGDGIGGHHVRAKRTKEKGVKQRGEEDVRKRDEITESCTCVDLQHRGVPSWQRHEGTAHGTKKK